MLGSMCSPFSAPLICCQSCDNLIRFKFSGPKSVYDFWEILDDTVIISSASYNAYKTSYMWDLELVREGMWWNVIYYILYLSRNNNILIMNIFKLYYYQVTYSVKVKVALISNPLIYFNIDNIELIQCYTALFWRLPLSTNHHLLKCEWKKWWR